MLDLAQNHISAALLLAQIRHALPRLSEGAPQYYIAAAVNDFWSAPGTQHAPSDASPQDAVNKLNKLRPIGSLKARPYLDAWIRYMQLCARSHEGEIISPQELSTQYQNVMSEAKKVGTSREISAVLLENGF